MVKCFRPTSMQADPALSRAGSLPQGIWGVCEVRDRLGKTVGARLLAMTAAHSTSMQTALTRWAGVSYCQRLETPYNLVGNRPICVLQICEAGLRRLAPLPTTAPESAGLSTLDPISTFDPVTAHQ